MSGFEPLTAHFIMLLYPLSYITFIYHFDLNNSYTHRNPLLFGCRVIFAPRFYC